MSYKLLKEEFDAAVEELRQSCPHKDISEWMDEWWGIGHSTGSMVRVCTYCEKIVERKGSRPIETKTSGDEVIDYTSIVQFHDRSYGDERDNGLIGEGSKNDRP